MIRAPRTCPICGKSFVPSTWNERFCPRCRDGRTFQQLVAEEKKARRARAAANVSRENRCPFCGHPVPVPNTFCRTCLDKRFDKVYKVTGRSNGWERRRGLVEAEDGWRGPRVVGTARLED